VQLVFTTEVVGNQRVHRRRATADGNSQSAGHGGVRSRPIRSLDLVATGPNLRYSRSHATYFQGKPTPATRRPSNVAVTARSRWASSSTRLGGRRHDFPFSSRERFPAGGGHLTPARAVRSAWMFVAHQPGRVPCPSSPRPGAMGLKARAKCSLDSERVCQPLLNRAG